MLLSNVVLLAQEAADGGGDGGLLKLLGSPIWLIAAFFFLFYFLLLRPQKREEARRQSMLGALKKNDRVITSGGIHGVVTNIQRESDEVTIKVDEATNTKLRVTLGSIAIVLGEEAAEGDKK